MIFTLGWKPLCVGTNFSSQLMSAAVCLGRAGVFLTTLEVSEVILGQDNPGHLHTCIGGCDWIGYHLLHTLAPARLVSANCGGGFTLSLCVLLPPSSPKHFLGKCISNMLALLDLLTWGSCYLITSQKLSSVKCLPKRGDCGRQARRYEDWQFKFVIFTLGCKPLCVGTNFSSQLLGTEAIL